MASEFAETTLGRLMSFANGRSSPERADGLPYPVYGSNGVIGRAGKANADAGSIVIGRVGSYCGSLYFSNKRCWVTDNAIRATALDDNDSRFLFYLLGTLGLNNWRAGSGQPLLNQDILSRIPAAVPEPVEQRAIAHILGTLDDKIELNRKQNETLEAMARALFKAWFVDFEPVRAKIEGRWQRGQTLPGLPAHLYDLFPDSFEDSELGEIPKGWACVEFKDAVEIADGRTLPPERRNKRGPFEVFGANGVIGCTSVPSIDSRCIILGKIGTCGSLHRSARPCWVTSNAFVIRAGRSVSLEFAWWLLLRIDFSQFVGGSANPYMPLKNFGHYKVLLPDTRLLHAFEVRAGACRERMDAIDDESRTLAALRDALLPKLISGELRVKDAERFLEERGL